MAGRWDRFFLVCLLLAALLLLLAATPFVGLTQWSHVTIAKLIGSSGLCLDIAGIIQLEISGAFDKLMDQYGDIERYPYGPPSRITRQIVDDAEAPIRTAIRNTLFFEHQTAIRLLVVGFFLQLSSVWVWV
ncbi:hypothetical protein [Bradyrhizobium australafricanum]|uniref:hypothetical protein n=1 Tax=Bradyrhizobium australafricanum TaxID=2821406 RepID=UPI001CE233D2|nr:hypothetical protein [Bradyrhizobium australafricanum]MCA6101213.1 hypothetical protein [Bradyrhizobium australafricanum]